MNPNYLKNIPQWYKDTKDYELILTDDIDSLLSCAILEHVKGWHIEQTMLFKASGSKDTILYDYLGVTENSTQKDEIGVDLALTRGKCFDNHVTRLNYQDKGNLESINPNIMDHVNRNNYWKKYAMSTVLLLWSIYDLPKENLSDELMMMLLTIDASYVGYYDEYFRQYTKHYLVDVLDLPEFYRCLSRHKKHEFMDIQRKYKLKEKIGAKKGYLETDIKIDAINKLLARNTKIKITLPTAHFSAHKTFIDVGMGITHCQPNSIEEIESDIFCYALTTKHFLNYSQEVNA